jgi:hypothetical protein
MKSINYELLFKFVDMYVHISIRKSQFGEV